MTCECAPYEVSSEQVHILDFSPDEIRTSLRRTIGVVESSGLPGAIKVALEELRTGPSGLNLSRLAKVRPVLDTLYVFAIRFSEGLALDDTQLRAWI